MKKKEASFDWKEKSEWWATKQKRKICAKENWKKSKFVSEETIGWNIKNEE